MIERIDVKPSWEFLKETELPVVLYGMGNGADMIADILEEAGIKIRAVFASDGFVRGHSFRGFPVLTLNETQELLGDFVVVMTFAVHDEAMLAHVRQIAKQHTLISPTVPIAGKGLFTLDYIKEHDEDFERAFACLADEKSKEVFLDVLRYKISGDVSYLFSCQSDKEEVYESILKLSQNEVIADLGAYDGDTVREFLSYTGGKYQEIFAFEPDEKNFKKLERKTAHLENMHRFQLGAWDKKETLYFAKKGGRNSKKSSAEKEKTVPVCFDSVDNVINGEVSFIKMDIEGAEKNALDGARKTIAKYRPKLYVCAYHRNEDFFALTDKILEICPDYKIYLRHHPYIPAWETNIYAVAQK